MRFGVLGPLAVWTSGGRPVHVPEVKVRTLLADLLAQRGRPVSADRLIDDLWGDEPPGNPSNTLQTKVSQLRRALERAEPGGRELVALHPAGYVLRAGDVDAEQFTVLLTRARATGDPLVKAGLLADALALWRGRAYADFPDAEFARSAATGLEEQRLTALEEQAELRLAMGDHSLLADELTPLVAEHPARERLRAAHLRALYRSGRQSEALAGFDEVRRSLAEELGLDPGPELTALHQAMLRQDPALAPAVPPATSAVRPRPNLPAPIAELVGREEQVEAVGRLLGSARLVTITGPGGVGKTRLALAAAAESPDDAWLVELAALRGGGVPEVAGVVAGVLGVRDEIVGRARPADLADRLAGALRGHRMLLVLDNCEHLVEPVAELVLLLLRDAPGLRILVTSQEPLAIAGESLHQLGPLGPDDAAELFRARAGVPLGTDDEEWVTAICSRLDGLPLALELAAARVRTLGVRGVAERLDDRFELLSATTRGLPARQRTLRAVIEWSWDQLDPEQHAALGALAVHPGGCPPEASGVRLELLEQLVNRSMVVAEPQPSGEMRYRLLESVAAFCLERLDGAGEMLGRRDAYYADLVRQADLYGPAQGLWLQRLDQEWPNLRAVLDHVPHRELTVRLAWYWYLRGKHNEGHRRLSAIPDDAEAAVWARGFAVLTGKAAGPVPVNGSSPRARWFLALAHLHFGDSAAAGELIDGALAGFRLLDDQWGTAAALASRTKQALFEGDLALAERSGTDSLALFAALGDRWGRLQAADMLGYLAEMTGDYERAARLHRDGLRHAEELRLWVDASYRLSSLGRVALLTGDFARAKEFHERGMRLAAEQSSPFAVEFARIGLALVARRSGDLDGAEAHLREALAWHRRMADEHGEPHYGVTLVLAELGFLAEQRGDAAQARASHRESLAAARVLGDPRAIALAHEGLAGAAALAGSAEEAETLLAEAAALRASAGAPLPAAERGDVTRIEARIRATVRRP